jgi:hypothetical protein
MGGSFQPRKCVIMSFITWDVVAGALLRDVRDGAPARVSV